MYGTLPHIIEGCKQNDGRAQEALYSLCYPEMIKVCLRYAFGDGDTAGSLFNTAMLKVFRNVEAFRSEGAFLGWVRKIVLNVCIDHCRIRTRFQVIEIRSAPEYILPVLPDIYHKISSSEIVELVHQLPRNTGLVFNLFVLEGYKHEEIAGILGISPGTSKWHLNEARRLLKQKIELLFHNQYISNVI